MVDVYAYTVDLPDTVNEVVVPCVDGYTVYIDQDLPPKRRISALAHAVQHILRKDFERADAGQIEDECHAETSEQLWDSVQVKWCSPASVDSPEAGWKDS